MPMSTAPRRLLSVMRSAIWPGRPGSPGRRAERGSHFRDSVLVAAADSRESATTRICGGLAVPSSDGSPLRKTHQNITNNKDNR